MQDHGPWKILDSAEVYRDPWIEVRRDRVVRPDGLAGTHCVVAMKPGVSVLPMDDDGCVYLTEEFHYAVGRLGLEVVSGGIEPGESPEDTARREVEEELGLRAQRWTALGSVDPFTTIVRSPTALYWARGLSEVPRAPEGTERIRRVRMPWDEAVAAVLEGRITHGPSCVLILKVRWMLESQGA